MIHQTAIIHPTAKVHNSAEIGPFTLIGEGVIIRADVLIKGWTLIGSDGMVFNSRQEKARGRIEVMNGAIIGSHCSIHRGYKDKWTTIGQESFIMDHVNIGHDNQIGMQAVIGAGSVLAGFVTVGKNSWIGINSTVHQRRTIGESVMIGMGSVVTRDIPDYVKAYGNPCKVVGANELGINRRFKENYYG